MGKGDRRTKRGKIWRGTHGKTRLWSKERKKKKAPPVPVKTASVTPTA